MIFGMNAVCAEEHVCYARSIIKPSCAQYKRSGYVFYCINKLFVFYHSNASCDAARITVLSFLFEKKTILHPTLVIIIIFALSLRLIWKAGR
jgi:hypothetical protein